MNKTRLTAALLILFLMALSASGRPPKKRKVKHYPKSTSTQIELGVWGGLHARLHLTEGGGEIEFDCARGMLSGPVKLDPQGRFRVEGTYVRERSGPIRVGLTPVATPAVYTGSRVRATLTLTVMLSEEQTTVGPFKLRRGSEGRLWKCR